MESNLAVNTFRRTTYAGAMRMLSWLLVLGLLVGACGDGRPELAAWTEGTWDPLVAIVPSPADSDPAGCETALADLRSQSKELKPAPDAELGAAADDWLRRAETLMFDCAAGAEGFDYETGYADLERLHGEVSVLIESAQN